MSPRSGAILRSAVAVLGIAAAVGLPAGFELRARVLWVTLGLSLTRGSWRVALAAGAVCLMHPPFGWGAVAAWVGMAPWYRELLSAESAGRRLTLGFALGSALICVSAPWMVVGTPAPWRALAAAAIVAGALYAAAAGIAGWLLVRCAWPFAVLASAVLPLVDYLRAHNPGFLAPYLALPHSIAGNPLAAQAIEPLGFDLLGLVLSATNLGVAVAWLRGSWRAALWPFAGVAALHIYGAVRLATLPQPDGTIRVVAVPGYFKKDGREELIWAALDARRRDGVDLVVLPENAATAPSPEERDGMLAGGYLLLEQLRQEPATKVAPILTGLSIRGGRRPSGARTERSMRRNAIALVDRAAVQIKDKLVSAPVGESLAFGGFRPLYAFADLPEVEEEIAVVDAFGTLDVPGVGAVAPTICYEALFPDVFERRQVVRWDEVTQLVCISNAFWFDDSPNELRQGRAARVLHGIERRKPFVFVGTSTAEWTDSRGRLHRARDAHGPALELSVERVRGAPWPGFKSRWFRTLMALVVLGWIAGGTRAGLRPSP